MTIKHFTCEHGAAGIARTRLITPPPVPANILPTGLVWATDLDAVNRSMLGMTRGDCDRTEYSIDCDPATFIPWLKYRRRLTRGQREFWEMVPGSLLAHWWVSEQEVRLLSDAEENDPVS